MISDVRRIRFFSSEFSITIDATSIAAAHTRTLLDGRLANCHNKNENKTSQSLGADSTLAWLNSLIGKDRGSEY
jgi:hypothetical protein